MVHGGHDESAGNQQRIRSDIREIYYQITFGYLNLGSYDYLKAGQGLIPHNATGTVVSYGHYYNGNPPDLLLEAAGDMFVEFDANSYSQRSGFQLEIMVQNITGNVS